MGENLGDNGFDDNFTTGVGAGGVGGMNNKLYFIKIKNPLTGDKIFCCTNRTEMQIPI